MDKQSCFNCTHGAVCWLFMRLSSEQPMAREFAEHITEMCKQYKVKV